MLSCDVPGVSIARSIQRREATGRSWICCVETDVDTSDFVVSTIGDSPVTVTASATVAGLEREIDDRVLVDDQDDVGTGLWYRSRAARR